MPEVPAPKMTEEQRDALLLAMAGKMTEVLLAANEFKRVAPVIEELVKRVGTLETAVFVGVHNHTSDRPPPAHPPPQLSPPPSPLATEAHEVAPHRAPMQSVTSEVRKVGESIKAVALQNETQTTLLRTQAENTRKAIAVFVGVVLATMWGQCQANPPSLQSPFHRAPAPYSAPADPNPPAPLPALRR